MADAGLSQAFDDGAAAAFAAGGVVVDLEVGHGVVGEFRFGSKRRCRVLDDALDEFGHHFVRFGSIGAHRSREIRCAGDDVACRAAVEFTDGDDCRLVGADLARNDGLQRVDDCGTDDYRVVTALGHGAVTGRATHIHAEPVGVCHARTGLAAHGARIYLAPDMFGERAVDTFEHAR